MLVSAVRLLLVREAARELGVSPGRVRQLIARGRLPSVLVGIQRFIAPADLELVRVRKQTGRPKRTG